MKHKTYRLHRPIFDVAHKMNEEKYLTIVEKLSCAKSIEDIQIQCEVICSTLKVDHYSFILFLPDSITSPTVLHFNNLPKAWVDYYIENKLMTVDPVIKYSQNEVTPIIWENLKNYTNYNSAKQNQVFNKAKNFGINDGLSIPIKSPQGGLGILSFSVEDENKITDHFSTIPMAKLFASYIHDATTRIHKSKQCSSLHIKFTEREQQCLIWASEGKTTWEISQILTISERTVLFHLNNVTKKMGSINRQHAVAKAMRIGAVNFQFS